MLNQPTLYFLASLMIGSVVGPTANVPVAVAEDSPLVHFDLPPTAVATPVDSNVEDRTLVTVQIRLSSMIETAEVPRIDQWLVRCQPRDAAISIADYSPRTETASDIATPIQVKTTEEKTDSLGIGVNGTYGYTVKGNAGLDRATKNVNSMQFDRVAPLHAVTASGTINRGRGVYFKLRWTAEQILEGEKVFQLTLKVPPAWRGSLVDVSVLAQATRKSFAGWDRDTKTLGSANFVVAVYRQGDQDAAAMAGALADAEYTLRSVAVEHASQGRFQGRVNSLPSMLRHVAMKLDLEPKRPNTPWLPRLLLDRADPHMDRVIRKLPMPVRVAVLDYVELRDDFSRIQRPPATSTVTSLAVKKAR